MLPTHWQAGEELAKTSKTRDNPFHENENHHLAQLIQPLFPADLAPFASDIFALDETTWDAALRHLPALRALPPGDPGLLAGELAGRFNLSAPTKLRAGLGAF